MSDLEKEELKRRIAELESHIHEIEITVPHSTIIGLRDELSKAALERDEYRKDAERYRWCQDHPKEAQAMFWNHQSRKQRSAAIDKAREEK